MIRMVAPEITSLSWYCLGPKLDKSRNSSSCPGGCSPGPPLLEKTRAGVRGWVTALVFPHCSVIFLHFPGQPVALCTRHWPSACVQTGTRLNVDKRSWWDRNWTNCHKESAPSKQPESVFVFVPSQVVYCCHGTPEACHVGVHTQRHGYTLFSLLEWLDRWLGVTFLSNV